MEFIDTHCHLDLPEFNHDRDQVMAECALQGIASILVPGVTLPFEEMVHFNNLQPNIYRAAGLHPWWLKSYFNDGYAIANIAEHLIAACEQFPIMAIGEAGLDRPRSASNGVSLAVQIECVEHHIRAANTLKLPVIFHCVKAHAELLAILKRCPVIKGGIIHGFAGSIEDARQFVDKGMKIGVGGTITYERARKTREAVKLLNSSDLVLETDAPSMPIDGMQGRRNEPINLITIAEKLALLRQENLEEVARYTTQNARMLFGLQV